MIKCDRSENEMECIPNLNKAHSLFGDPFGEQNVNPIGVVFCLKRKKCHFVYDATIGNRRA